MSELTEEYAKLCFDNPKFNRVAMKRAVEIGDNLVQRFRAKWCAKHGDNFSGVFDFELDGLIDRDLLAYLLHVAKHGVAARQPHLNTRVHSKPHRPVLDYVEEAFEKLWKDAHRGRVVLCSSARDESG